MSGFGHAKLWPPLVLFALDRLRADQPFAPSSISTATVLPEKL
jgi:hypothetical protein